MARNTTRILTAGELGRAVEHRATLTAALAAGSDVRVTYCNRVTGEVTTRCGIIIPTPTGEATGGDIATTTGHVKIDTDKGPRTLTLANLVIVEAI